MPRVSCARSRQDEPDARGVFGRKAGAAPGYNYSPGLRETAVRWSADTLDRWLADRKFIPGARMPVRVLDPTTRRDIISYLRSRERQVSAAGISHQGAER